MFKALLNSKDVINYFLLSYLVWVPTAQIPVILLCLPRVLFSVHIILLCYAAYLALYLYYYKKNIFRIVVGAVTYNTVSL